ncbi:copper resistance CopC/CopD family protein [Auraticoccus monumenti]|uniref:Copper transport protein n=1 Tax=Auraticoccus monumenti TaxID=675864 RepID=A0A1G6SG92_9ACTN|nr:copper resistance protein CopC [Auraticoccus monumenti]SDD15177.1 copper transport protein [Auraticoccus monumenti]
MTAGRHHSDGEQGRHRLLRRLLVGAALTVLVLLSGAPAARAHAGLEGSTPATGTVLPTAPGEVALDFTEPVSPAVEGMRLLRADGRAEVLTATARDDVVTVPLPADLGEGTHLLSWRVVSADSHPVAGVVTFSVGAPSADPPAAPDTGGSWLDTLDVGLRSLAVLGLLVAVGLAGARLLVLRADAPASLDRAVTVSAAGGAAAALLHVPVEWLALQGVGPAALAGAGAWPELLCAPAALSAGVAVSGLALLALAHARGLRRPRTAGALPTEGPGHRDGRAAGARRESPPTALVLLGTGLAVASLPVAGHTRTYGPAWLMVVSDLTHGLAGSVWVGGVLALVLALRAAGARPVEVVRRFSALAAGSVLLLAVTGTTMAVLVLERWADLVGTEYGRALLVKLGLVAVVLVLAGWNRRVVLPRLDGDGEAWSGLRRTLLNELGLLVAVVALTGVLISADPLSSGGGHSHGVTTVSPVAQPLDLGDARATVLLTPAVTGANQVLVTLQTADGAPLEPEAAPTVRLSLPAQGLGPLEHELVPTDRPGEFRADVDVPVAGSWDVTLAVRVSPFSEPVGTVAVPVG